MRAPSPPPAAARRKDSRIGAARRRATHRNHRIDVRLRGIRLRVLRNSVATWATAATMHALSARSLGASGNGVPASNVKARTVAIHVRKSFAVKSAPVISRRYSLTRSEVTGRRTPSSSRYWNSSCPGSCWQRRTIAARRRSSIATSCSTPPLPRNESRARPSRTNAACRLRSVVRP